MAKVYRIELELTGWDMVSVVMGAVDKQSGIKIIDSIREVSTIKNKRHSSQRGMRKAAPGGGPTQQDKFEDHLGTLASGTVLTLVDAAKWFKDNGMNAASASSVVSKIAREKTGLITRGEFRGSYKIV